jgi:hypothetical protein
MKGKVFLLCVLVAAGPVFGQGAPVTLANNEGMLAWYVVDPPELGVGAAASPELASLVSEYLGGEGGAFPFSWLGPDQQVTLEGLAAGSHLLLVLFDDGGPTLPVRAITLQVDSGLQSRVYGLYAVPAVTVAARGQGRLQALGPAEPAEEPAEAPQDVEPAEQTAEGAQATEPTETPEAPEVTGEAAPGLEQIVDLPPDWDPRVFSRERGGELVVLPTSEAAGWGRPGTRIQRAAGALTDGGFVLDVLSPEGFSDGTSLFLYVFSDRAAGVGCPFTVELHLDAGRAVAAVWRRGDPMPSPAGTVTLSDPAPSDGLPRYLLWSVAADQLPAGLAGIGPGATVDFTTAWLDTGTASWEEFYVTTFALADVTR